MHGWRHDLRRALMLLGLVGGLLAGGPAAAVSLNEALVTTYLTNPELEAGRAQLRQTDELVPQALAGYRPNVFIDSGVEGERATSNSGRSGLGNLGAVLGTDADIGGGGGVGASNRSTSSVALTLQQNLYAGGGTQAQVSRAENQVTAQRARLLAQEQQTLLDAVDAYTATFRDQRVLDLALNNEERLGRQLEATRDRFEVGEVARTDVAQAEARLARARADIETAKADLAASRALYERVVGEPPRRLDEPRILRDLPRTYDDALAMAANSPDVLAATFDLYAARDDVDVVFSDLLPSLDLQAQAGYQDQPSSATRWSRNATLGVNLTIPLYQGGAAFSRVRESRERVRQRRDDLETTQRSIQEVVTSSWERLLASTASIEAFDAEVGANNVALEGVQQETLVGARTVLDVLDAEQELFTSQVNLVRAQRDEIVASYQLKLAVGQLNVTELELPVEPFDEGAYYERQRTRLFGID